MAEKKFTKEHEWIEKSDQIIIVGITEFAQDQLGDIVSIELPQVASSFKQNDVMAIIDSVKASSDIYCPVDGEIIEMYRMEAEKVLNCIVPTIYKQFHKANRGADPRLGATLSEKYIKSNSIKLK